MGRQKSLRPHQINFCPPTAVRDLLDRPSFREAAARLAQAISLAPGAAGAADVLEELARLQEH